MITIVGLCQDAAVPHDEQRVFRRILEGVIGVPATEGNLIEVLRNGNEIFPAMLECIDSAGSTIDLLTFVYWRGEVGTAFAESLSARSRAGVRVRVLLDAWGARPMDRARSRRWRTRVCSSVGTGLFIACSRPR